MEIQIDTRNVRRTTIEGTIQTWLVEQICQNTGLLPRQIDIGAHFSSYGIDSIAATGLSGELGNWLGKQLAPTIIWDYPSIQLLARHLASSLAEDRGAAA